MGRQVWLGKMERKHYIGIDISQEYVEYARKRLQNAEKEKVRVLQELSLHTVQLTFEDRKKKGMCSKKRQI